MIYRPPDTDIREFNDYILQCLDQIKAEKRAAYLLGDYNINLLNVDAHAASQDFVDIMFSHFFFPAITKSTRVTEKSATLIDNIFHNCYSEVSNSFSGILYTDVSDHFPVYHIDYSVSVCSKRKTLKKRIFSVTNMERFTSAMSEKNWNTVLNDNDPQNAYTTFHSEFSEMYDACFPIKMFKEGYRTRKPWLSEEMKRSIKVKNKLYMHYKKSGNREDEMVYKKYRNTLNKILVEAERKHYESLLNEDKSNLQKSWCIVKEVINK